MSNENLSKENRAGKAGPKEDMNRDEYKNEETESGAGPAASGDGAASAPAATAARAAQGSGEILPSKAAEDDARSWGDREDDHDTWLKEQKPPHWG